MMMIIKSEMWLFVKWRRRERETPGGEREWRRGVPHASTFVDDIIQWALDPPLIVTPDPILFFRIILKAYVEMIPLITTSHAFCV